jgi:hypothetical protein
MFLSRWRGFLTLVGTAIGVLRNSVTYHLNLVTPRYSVNFKSEGVYRKQYLGHNLRASHCACMRSHI